MNFTWISWIKLDYFAVIGVIKDLGKLCDSIHCVCLCVITVGD